MNEIKSLIDPAMQVLSVVIISVTIIFLFVAFLRIYLGKKTSVLKAGFKVLVLMGFVYLFRAKFFEILPKEFAPFQDEFTKTVATIWWSLLGLLIRRSLNKYLWYGILKGEGKDSAVPTFVISVFNGFVLLIIVMIIMNYVFGQPITPLLATSGAAAIVLGYSAQSTLAQVFSGISLNLSPNMKKGDVIELNGMQGEIVELNWRSVIIKDDKNNHMIIPNDHIANSIFKNLSLFEESSGRTIEFYVGHAYSAKKVIDLVQEAVKNVPQVLRDPVPYVYINKFQEGALEYSVMYFVHKGLEGTPIHAQVTKVIWHTLWKNNIPFAYARHVRSTIYNEKDFKYPPPKPKSQKEVLDVMKGISIFKHFTVEDKKQIAKECKRREYYENEVIIYEGQMADTLHLVASGTTEVFKLSAGDKEATIVDLEGPRMIGEVAFLTGEARTAYVRAKTHVVTYEIEKQTVYQIFQSKPEVIEKLAEHIADIQEENEQKVRKFNKKQALANRKKNKNSFIEKIRQFFAMDN